MVLNFEQILNDNHADCLLINTFDEFLSEYTANEHNLLFKILGFSGSNGIALILKGRGYFFTDGRYLLQATNEVPSNFVIEHIKNFHGILSSLGVKKILIDKKRFSAKFCLDLIAKNSDIIFINWHHSLTPTFQNNETYYTVPGMLTGEASSEKIAKVRRYMVEQAMDCCYVTDCQNVCWLLNIRGKDEEFTPIYKTHLLITHSEISLGANTHINLNGKKVMIDSQINWEVYNNIVCEKVFCNFITNLKAIKNSDEITGVENAHKIDGKILTEFLYDIEANYNGLTEFDIGQKLLLARKKSEYFMSHSFATICGYNENGAIIHYNAKKENAKIINDGILLLDSGGQYCDFSGVKQIFGTTDVTRTICLGSPSDEYKTVFTLVLKGHIAVAMAEFPEGTLGKNLDILARKPLIDAGYNYDHGTGHGVGAFLSVHEGGVGISPSNNTILKEGMLVSNEPGCYIEGRFGVRIESLVLVVQKNNGLLGFNTVTLVPIQEKSVNFNLLTDEEKNWLKWYNNCSIENAKC